jgi:biotin transport system substrate-specific component
MSTTTPVATLRRALITRETLTSQLALVIGGVLFLCAMAQISLPIPGSPVPVTGQTLAVLLLGSAYGATLGFTTFATYFAVGSAGLPFFAHGAHGFHVISGATGGYLVGMLLSSAITGALAGRKWDQKIATVIPTMILGNIATFSCGLIWLHHVTAQSWTWTISKGFTPFVLGEVIKIAIASTTLPTLWRFVSKPE